jgi:hypothetical protein
MAKKDMPTPLLPIGMKAMSHFLGHPERDGKEKDEKINKLEERDKLLRDYERKSLLAENVRDTETLLRRSRRKDT